MSVDNRMKTITKFYFVCLFEGFEFERKVERDEELRYRLSETDVCGQDSEG